MKQLILPMNMQAAIMALFDLPLINLFFWTVLKMWWAEFFLKFWIK